MKLLYDYWTKARGIGGSRLQPEDFVVREILDPRLLRREDAKYTLFLVKKRNMTTHQAVKALQQLGWCDIGYAGLKDKFAVTWQYMSALAEPKDYKTKELEAVPVGRSRKLLPGDLICNAFVVTLHGCRDLRNLPVVVDELVQRGLPNYFGLQRFGRYGKNIEIGRHLVKKNFTRALDIINRQSGLRPVRTVPKEQLRFFVNAYQSWIFNEALNAYTKVHRKPYFGEMPLVGYKTNLGTGVMDNLLKEVCRKQSIKPADFRINELMMTCLGDRRRAFIRLSEIEYSLGSNVKLAFTLPKGSYATVLLREMCKN